MKIWDVVMIAATQGGGLTPFDSGIIDNGAFNSSSGWTLTGDAAISGGQLTATSGTASHDTNTALVSGSFYKITFTVTSGGMSGTGFTLGGGPITSGAPIFNTGTNSVYVMAGGANQTLVINAGAVAIDSVAVVAASSALSSEYVQNGTFDDATNWSLSGSVSIGSGVVTWTSAANLQLATNTPATAIEANAYYLATFTITSYTGGFGRIRVGNSSGVARNSAATYTQLIVAFDTGAPALASASGGTTFSADNYSVKKVTFT